MLSHPRVIDSQATFDKLVEWLHEVIVYKGAPGFLVGLSGTDSLVVFLAAYEAFKLAGKPSRVWGVHFAPSEDFLYDHPEAETHLWFSKEVIPWLRQRCPEANVEVDTSVDWRMDGRRWGWLLDASSMFVREDGIREMRRHDEKFWVLGTRNKSEERLFSYSRASLGASVQPIVDLWKSEILQISKYLRLPKIAVEKSCEADCLCGRERLPAKHPREIDTLLMVLDDELDVEDVDIPEPLCLQLRAYILAQRERCRYKAAIPYKPLVSPFRNHQLVAKFEAGTLDLRGFDHRKHLYVAWCYLKAMSFEDTLKRYCHYLKVLLEKVGRADKFSAEITEGYISRLALAMEAHPDLGFEELMSTVGEALNTRLVPGVCKTL